MRPYGQLASHRDLAPNTPPVPVARDTGPKGALDPLERGPVRLGLMDEGKPKQAPSLLHRSDRVLCSAEQPVAVLNSLSISPFSDAGGAEVGMRVAPRYY